MNNGIPVKLHIKSTQSGSEDAIDRMEFYTEGSYYEKQGSKYITYAESEVSGLEGTTTVLKLAADEAFLIRHGAFSSRMVFRAGYETKNEYTTQYGVFDLSVYTQELDINVCNELINSVYLKYRLSINNGEAYTNEMNITVKYNS